MSECTVNTVMKEFQVTYRKQRCTV